MNKKKPYVYKRVIAYIIDLIVVTLISGILSIVLINNTKYNEESEKLFELTKKYTTNEIEKEDYYNEYNEINYNLTKESTGVTIITIGVTITYYVVLCYFCHGITLGKYLMKIKIVSANGKDLKIWNYLLRSLVINLILSHLSSVLLVNILSKSDFIKYYSKVSYGLTLLLLLSFIIIMFREDGRGIEDFMGNTKIVNIKDLEENVLDAKVLEEKENNKKEVDKNERTIGTRNSKKK